MPRAISCSDCGRWYNPKFATDRCPHKTPPLGDERRDRKRYRTLAENQAPLLDPEIDD